METLIYNLTLKPYKDSDFYEKIFLYYAMQISLYLQKSDFHCVVRIDVGNYTFVQDGRYCATDYPIIHIAISSERASEKNIRRCNQ